MTAPVVQEIPPRDPTLTGSAWQQEVARRVRVDADQVAIVRDGFGVTLVEDQITEMLGQLPISPWSYGYEGDPEMGGQYNVFDGLLGVLAIFDDDEEDAALAHNLTVLPDLLLDAVRQLRARRLHIERLESALAAVRSDRPSVHSDRVWGMIEDALDTRHHRPARNDGDQSIPNLDPDGESAHG